MKQLIIKSLKTAIATASLATAGIASADAPATPAKPGEYVVTRIYSVAVANKPVANYVFVRERRKFFDENDEPQTLREIRVSTPTFNPEGLWQDDLVNITPDGRVVLSETGRVLRRAGS